jgi:HlyD family secretion protein
VKKKRAIWLVVFTLVVGASLWAYYYQITRKSNQQSAEQSLSFQTAVARTGDLTISASGSGQVTPDSQIGLNFNESGTVIEVLARVGQEVKAGDVLVRLQSDKTEAQLAAEVAAAELTVVQAQQDLDDLYATAESDAAQTLIELENAQYALADVADLELEKANALQAAASAEEAITTAEMQLYIYNSVPSEEEIYTAYASLLFKQEDLERLQKQVTTAISKLKGVRDDLQRSRMEEQLMQLNLQLANQVIVVENATYKLNSLSTAADPLDVAVVEKQMATAQAELAAAQNEYQLLAAGPKPGDVAIAETNLAAAQAAWERIKDGPDPDQVALLQTQLQEAQLELDILRQESTVVNLIAPIDSTVIALNVNVGDRVDLGTDTSNTDTGTSNTQSEMDFIEAMLFGSSASSSTDDNSLVTIADLSQPLLEIYIDETDFQKVAVGYPVEVTFDAFPDETFTGKIIEISPSLESVSNVQAIVARVRLDVTSYAKPNPLPIGLNAQVEVIAGQATNAVLVPVEALVEVSPGVYIVYVVENNQPQPRNVSVGLIDFTSAEITEGLSVGEVVALDYKNNTGN